MYSPTPILLIYYHHATNAMFTEKIEKNFETIQEAQDYIFNEKLKDWKIYKYFMGPLK